MAGGVTGWYPDEVAGMRELFRPQPSRLGAAFESATLPVCRAGGWSRRRGKLDGQLLLNNEVIAGGREVACLSLPTSKGENKSGRSHGGVFSSPLGRPNRKRWGGAQVGETGAGHLTRKRSWAPTGGCSQERPNSLNMLHRVFLEPFP